MRQGDILVCQITNPTWAPIFQKIAGRGVRHRRLDEPRRHRGARVRPARRRRHRHRHLAHQGRPAHPRRRRPRRGHDPLVARRMGARRAYRLVRRDRARRPASRSAARAGASASCSAPASPCRRASSCKTGAFERFLAALEREAPVRAAVDRHSTPDDLEAITACSQALRAASKRRELPAEVLR